MPQPATARRSSSRLATVLATGLLVSVGLISAGCGVPHRLASRLPQKPLPYIKHPAVALQERFGDFRDGVVLEKAQKKTIDSDYKYRTALAADAGKRVVRRKAAHLHEAKRQVVDNVHQKKQQVRRNLPNAVTCERCGSRNCSGYGCRSESGVHAIEHLGPATTGSMGGGLEITSPAHTGPNFDQYPAIESLPPVE